MARGYPDPAAHLRGTYATEEGFRAIIAAAGGVVPLVEGCAARIGLKRASGPENGFIGVIGSRTDINRQFGGIWDADGKAWRVRCTRDYPLMRAHPLAIWEV